jgi:hypothetical protein
MRYALWAVYDGGKTLEKPLRSRRHRVRHFTLSRYDGCSLVNIPILASRYDGAA